MKSTFLSILALAAIICFTACKNEKKEEAAPAPTTEAPATPAAPAATDVQATPTPPPAQSAEPAQNAKGVWHYICSKNCPGGAGSQGTCPKCGAPMQHNTAYHQQ